MAEPEVSGAFARRRSAVPLPPAAAVIPVRPGGEILLMLRDDRPDLPNANRWSTIGGAVEPGETPEQAARREVEEELGRPPPSLVPAGTIDGARFRSFIFAAPVTWSLDDLVLGEGQGVDWLSRDAVLASPLARGIAPGISRFLELDSYRKMSIGQSPGPALKLPPLPDTLVGELGLRLGQLLAVRGATAAFVRRLWDVLGGIRVTASPGPDERPDALLWWPGADSTAAVLGEWRGRLAAGGAVWAVVGSANDAPGLLDRLRAGALALRLQETGALELPTGERALRFGQSGAC